MLVTLGTVKSVKVGSGQFTLCVVQTFFFQKNLIP